MSILNGCENMTYQQDMWDFLQKEIEDAEAYVEYNVSQTNFFLKEIKNKPDDFIGFNSYQVSELERFINKYKGSTDYLQLLYRLRHNLLVKRDENNKKEKK